MTFDKVNRRTHLYLGIVLTPWFLLYAVSSVFLNHDWLSRKMRQPEQWTKQFERHYNLGPLTDDSDQWALGEKMLKDFGMEGRYRAFWDDDDNLVVTRQGFASHTRLTYYPAKEQVVAEYRRLPWNQAVVQAHFRAGFSHSYFSEILWAITIDLLVLSTLIWIASGIYLWVRLRRFRFWGWFSLASGMASFFVLILVM